MGASASEHEGFPSKNPENMSTYITTGTVPKILVNRQSYIFDFKGPSVVVDSACSNSSNIHGHNFLFVDAYKTVLARIVLESKPSLSTSPSQRYNRSFDQLLERHGTAMEERSSRCRISMATSSKNVIKYHLPTQRLFIVRN